MKVSWNDQHNTKIRILKKVVRIQTGDERCFGTLDFNLAEVAAQTKTNELISSLEYWDWFNTRISIKALVEQIEMAAKEQLIQIWKKS